ncbi:MAG: helix-turn-helix transcriptional regulator [Bacteroidales bacterium]|jgi:transcriptional regulator with XRE-family HTH domain|nr:helix-turn-helix transcriptional regulator [Bacteroidales bacterium]
MKERIQQFLLSENKTSAQLAEEIGVQPSGISHILSGRNKPSLDFVIKMLERYKYLSTEWLMFGKGEMYKERTMPGLFDDVIPAGDSKAGAYKDSETELKNHGSSSHDEDSMNISEKERIPCPELREIVWFYGDGTYRIFKSRES